MTHDTDSTDPTRIAFVCVRNAGRSQMSAAVAEREVRRRGLDWEILTGGTDPADAVHDVVVEAMDEVGIDLSDRTPRAISESELRSCDVVATMGCSTLDVGTVGDAVDVRDWALTDPGERDLDEVRAIRDDIEERVTALIDELAA
jgi:protein-tyrosine-phosphatase